MRQNFLSLIAGMAVVAGLTSCATLFTKSHQDVTFKGLPGTTVIDKKKNTTVAEVGQNGFSTVKLRKSLSGKDFLVTRDGYEDGSAHLGTKVQGAFWANIILGGIPGMAIDAATGKMMKFNTDLVDVTLTRKKATSKPQQLGPVMVEPQEAVDCNNPGQTEMEKTIVRWYMDSDPRGARVFWRVISNVPDQVKNTNESYLTTTPIEETRSFNIPGLTYDNSRDVTIEIKVTKRGYEDQVKRYNVRQALDQQEISGFFELVPKD